MEPSRNLEALLQWLEQAELQCLTILLKRHAEHTRYYLPSFHHLTKNPRIQRPEHTSAHTAQDM